MKKTSYAIVGAVALGLISAGVLLWQYGQAPSQTPTAPPPPPAAVSQRPGPAAPEPTVKHPIDAAVTPRASTAPLDVEAALIELFGRKAVLSMFQLRDFPRRFVATVDNLGRAYAPARLWPVNPADGRFIVEKRDDAEIIGADNGSRYSPYVLLIETVNLHQAVAVYARLYPLFQQAYEEIGYPKRYFNDRLVEVIDQLLATPEPNGPLKVNLPQIKGPMQLARPWAFYEFDDPALQSLSAGQKMLLRMGPVNERRMKAKLAEIRRLVTARTVSR